MLQPLIDVVSTVRWAANRVVAIGFWCLLVILGCDFIDTSLRVAV